jgi:Icc-related predicted phosphoesterase
MKLIVAIADLHGNLPEIPECDLLLIGGDICPAHNHDMTFQYFWLKEHFEPWLEKVPAKKIVGVAGNHDFLAQANPDAWKWLSWDYLHDSGTEFEGFKIWGAPWQPVFYNWAFNLPEEQLSRKWDLIPDDTDILVLHGPPKGYGDFVPRGVHTGSPSLTERILKVNPRLAVCGHIHYSRGIYQCGETAVVNAALVNEAYVMVHAPVLIDASGYVAKG